MKRDLGILAGVVAVQAFVLRLQGRPWTCACGSVAPWSGDIWSAHNSQHFLDPYSFTHLLHGVLFYAALHLAMPRASVRTRLLLTVVLEVGWELFENSEVVINRYRAATVSLGYVGDSVINSIGDVLCCTLGFLFAARAPVRVSLAAFVVIEAAMLAVYRDSLLLNVLMLLWPSPAIRTWQGG